MNQSNIVMISIDSLRQDFCSFLNPNESTTPFMTELASNSEGVGFSKAISPSVWTLPVHGSIFTGLYPLEHGVVSEGSSLGEHLTLAESLTHNGYYTAAFLENDWLRTGNILRGFEDIYPEEPGGSGSKSIKHRISTQVGNISKLSEQAIEDVFYTWKFYKEWNNYLQPRNPGIVRNNQTISRGIRALKNASSPFFFFIHINDAHWPYSPPRPYHRIYTDRSPLSLSKNRGITQRRVFANRENRLQTTADQQTPPDKEIQTFENLYRGCIRYVDDLIKSFVEELKKRDYWKNTSLVIFGDHGDNFGENNLFGHHFSVSDELIRVPLLIHSPKVNIHNKIDPRLVQLNDLYPTVAKMVNSDYENTNSIDFFSETRDYAYVYYEIQQHGFWETVNKLDILPSDLPPDKQYAVWRNPGEKAVWYPDVDRWKGSIESSSESIREALKQHSESLDQVTAGEYTMSSKTKERLEDMGYLR